MNKSNLLLFSPVSIQILSRFNFLDKITFKLLYMKIRKTELFFSNILSSIQVMYFLKKTIISD